MSSRIAASIRSRLQNRWKNNSDTQEFEFFLIRYACERFLFRLGVSQLRDQFVLKGASLLMIWMNEPHRATRDIDLLALDEQNLGSVRQAIAVICDIPCPEDGIEFILASLRGCAKTKFVQ